MPEIVEQLQRSPGCGAQARRLLEHHFGEELPSSVLISARTVVSELANNAYLHGRGEIELQMSLRDGRLRVEVVDEGQGAALEVRQAGKAGGGNGLRLVDALSSDWGSFEGTTHVWAEFAIQD